MKWIKNLFQRKAKPPVVKYTGGGFRSIGERKKRMINIVNKQLTLLGNKGLNVKYLRRKILKGKGPYSIPTKRWPGIIGQLKQIEKGNIPKVYL